MITIPAWVPFLIVGFAIAIQLIGLVMVVRGLWRFKTRSKADRYMDMHRRFYAVDNEQSVLSDRMYHLWNAMTVEERKTLDGQFEAFWKEKKGSYP